MSNRITEEQKKIAIKEYAKCGTMTRAAGKAGVCRMTLYEEEKRDKSFKAKMLEAKKEYIDGLEDVLDSRIKSSTDKASAILLMFKLKKENPDYRDKIEHKVESQVTIISGVPRPKGAKDA